MKNTITRNYPRVLIIGNAFEGKTGTGITLTNLFTGWPKERLAVAAGNYMFKDLMELDICSNYYQMGNKEIKYLWPFNYFIAKQKSRIIDYELMKSLSSQEIVENGKLDNNKLWRLYYNYGKSILFSLGIDEIRLKTKVSINLIDWIEDFNPDVIYTLLGDLNITKFIAVLAKRTQKPLAIHIMDDWPNRKRIFGYFWNRRINSELIKIFRYTRVFMAISQSMSEEYRRRYNKTFLPFQNPIDLSKWQEYNRKSYSFDGALKIMYIGKINLDNCNSLIEMSHVINNLRNEGVMVQFEIFTPTVNVKFQKEIFSLQGIKIHPSVKHEQIPELLSSADVLFLPLDFTKKCIQYTRFSMPAKTAEYMASGVPVIVYSDIKTALNKYASDLGWAYVIPKKGEKYLREAILDLHDNEDYRIELGNLAKRIVKKHHCGITVRDRFRAALNNLIEDKK